MRRETERERARERERERGERERERAVTDVTSGCPSVGSDTWPEHELLMLRPIPGMSMSRFIQLHLDGASGLDRATTPTQLHLDGALLGRPLDSRPPYGFPSQWSFGTDSS